MTDQPIIRASDLRTLAAIGDRQRAVEHLDLLFAIAPELAHPANADGCVRGCHPLTYGDLVALRALLSLPLPVASAWQGIETWKHKVRGSVVSVVGHGRAQASTRPINDLDPITIYQHDGGKWWARRTEEFEDGRFEQLTSSPLPVEGEREDSLTRRINNLLDELREEKRARQPASYWTDQIETLRAGLQNIADDPDTNSEARVYANGVLRAFTALSRKAST